MSAFEIYMRERKTQLLRAAAYKIAGGLPRAPAALVKMDPQNPGGELTKILHPHLIINTPIRAKLQHSAACFVFKMLGRGAEHEYFSES